MNANTDTADEAARLDPILERQFSDALDRIRQRIEGTLAETAPGFPHYADGRTGQWTRSPAGDWTGGFWVGQLWLLAHQTKDGSILRAARKWSERLTVRTGDDTIFRGFLFWYGCAIGDILHNDAQAAQVAAAAARALHATFLPQAGLMPLGADAEEAFGVGHTATNIDGVPGGTPLLVRYSTEADDGMTADAHRHAGSHARLCVREDGSVCQSATFDPESGELVQRYTHKGYSDESTWGRAQTWAMLGFAQAAAFSGRDRFLPVALTVADWYVGHLPATGVAHWDFDDPSAPDTSIDTSATAIAAASLLKLAALDPSRKAEYQRAAYHSLSQLIAGHQTPQDPLDRRPAGMLLHGCYNRRLGLAQDDELIWGDYFLHEALLAATGRLDPTTL